MHAAVVEVGKGHHRGHARPHGEKRGGEVDRGPLTEERRDDDAASSAWRLIDHQRGEPSFANRREHGLRGAARGDEAQATRGPDPLPQPIEKAHAEVLRDDGQRALPRDGAMR